MYRVNVYFENGNEPFLLKMDDKELDLFLGFTNDQDVTDVFDHSQDDWNIRVFKKHITFVEYKKVEV